MFSQSINLKLALFVALVAIAVLAIASMRRELAMAHREAALVDHAKELQTQLKAAKKRRWPWQTAPCGCGGGH